MLFSNTTTSVSIAPKLSTMSYKSREIPTPTGKQFYLISVQVSISGTTYDERKSTIVQQLTLFFILQQEW